MVMNAVAAPPQTGTVVPTGQVRTFSPDETIVTKTDLKGVITYANDVFLRVSATTEEQALGQPHNLIRHPGMPAGVYKLLWDRLESGQEIFAYVMNLALDGVAYWVFAHVTPTIGPNGRPIAYHSTRRAVATPISAEVDAVYRKIRAEELHIKSRRERAEYSLQLLQEYVAGRGQSYDEWVWSLATSRKAHR